MKGISKRKKKNIILIAIVVALAGFIIGAFVCLYNIGFFKSIAYPPSHFDYTILKSAVDFNENDIDDYTDILEGAKTQAKKKPKYKDKYYEGGYPPENEGTCTDLFWRALKNAGYDFKALIDVDIAENPEEYPNVKEADNNIDFRRVKNIKVFLDRRTASLTTDLNQYAQWQPGDIVVFEDKHIGVISELRNEDGVPFLIHHSSKYQLYLEEDALERLNKKHEISGHYRWDLR